MHESVYIVRDHAAHETIASSLRALLPIRHHAIARHRFTMLDTFDGRVRRAGARLTTAGSNGSSFVAWQPRGRHVPLTAGLTQPVGFAWDLPVGPLHDAVAPVVGVRRLLPQVDGEAHGSTLDILDDRRKTVVRLRLESGQVRHAARHGWQTLPTVLTLTALRGYEDAYVRLKPVIESRPGIAPCPEGWNRVLLQHAGIPDASPLPSLQLDLAPDVPADAGARHIHRALAAIMAANEPGLRANLDSEFLHDFRVALRRTRSLVRQLKHVFPDDIVEHFSSEFSWLGRLTGPPRDLDVLALSLRADDRLPAPDLDAVIGFLSHVQERERTTLVNVLDSARYRTLLAGWQRFLEQPPIAMATASDARRPLADVVSRRAWRLSKRIAQSRSTIGKDADPIQLHEVRITAKKLRYLIDVTGSFYDAADLECVLTALKKTQRALGDVNDAHIQERCLLDLGLTLGVAGGPPSAVLALGQLAERSRQRRDRLRPEAIAQLRQFCAPATRAACRRAFKREAIKERAR